MPKTEEMRYRISPHELGILKAAARIANQTVSAFARENALAVAEQLIRSTRTA